MTEQSNTAFQSQTFLDGANATWIDALQARHAADPASVDGQWAEYFRALGETEIDAKRAASGPSWARTDWPPRFQRIGAPNVAGPPVAVRLWRFATGMTRAVLRLPGSSSGARKPRYAVAPSAANSRPSMA